MSINGRLAESRPRMRWREKDHRVKFEVANLGAARAGLAASRRLGVSPKLREVTGYTRAELRGMAFLKVLPSPRSREELRRPPSAGS